MKLVPFLISTVVAAVALVLAIIHFTSGASNLDLQAQLQQKQQTIQELREAVDTKQREFQSQQQIIEAGASVAQKYGPPILRDMGILAAKNKNEKIKNLLVRQKLEAYIPNAEQLKQIEEEAKRAQNQPPGAAKPAPAATTPNP
jgi:hypothetical protein